MLEILQKIFIGYVHKWVVTDTYKRQTYKGRVGNVVKLPQCSHCGKMKTFEIT